MKTQITIVGFFAMALTAGCTLNREGDAKYQDPFFRGPAVESHVTRILRQATDAGAAHEATLQARHFDGAVLNPVGHERLRAIIAGTPEPKPLVVYLSIPADDAMASARRASVEAAVMASGIPADRFTLAEGSNSGVASGTAPLLEALGQGAGEGGGGESAPTMGGGASANIAH